MILQEIELPEHGVWLIEYTDSEGERFWRWETSSNGMLYFRSKEQALEHFQICSRLYRDIAEED